MRKFTLTGKTKLGFLFVVLAMSCLAGGGWGHGATGDNAKGAGHQASFAFMMMGAVVLMSGFCMLRVNS